MRYHLFLALLLSVSISFGQQKQVCFSIDDLPLVSYGISDTAYQRNLMDKLVQSLNRFDIPAIGFVNEQKLFDSRGLNSFQVRLLETWVKSGLELGNHTYSHPDYNKTSFSEFKNDILKGEIITSEIVKKQGKSLRYFRHPFLHTGDTPEKADSLSAFLTEKGYKVAPVTIDNDDYLFALAYKRAWDKKDQTLMNRIGNDYICYMERKLKYYEKQADRLFGKNINQILLIHASQLNSDYMDSLAMMFLRNNYTFVSMDKALQDDVYLTPVTVYLKMGISWIDRWALSRGMKGDFFRDEPASPDYIKRLAE